MRRLPIILFATTAFVAFATHFLHFADYIIEPNPNGANLGTIRGENLTRVAICTPLFVAATYVICSKRFPRPRFGLWWAGTMLTTLGAWWLLISN
jgi:hypothetical protein